MVEGLFERSLHAKLIKWFQTDPAAGLLIITVSPPHLTYRM